MVARARMTSRSQDIYISYGRPYGILDNPPHEWFEWVPSGLRVCEEDSCDFSNEWSLGSTYVECELVQSESYEGKVWPAEKTTSRRSDVMQKMNGWWRGRMSV